MTRFALSLLLLVGITTMASAGTGYEVTATNADGETVTYMVNFGGGMMFQQYTAWDPASEKFVHLSWGRQEEAPKPAGKIWDHETGRTIPLYKFPKVEQPLPVIPSIDAMKVCPKTGDRNFKHRAVIAYD